MNNSNNLLATLESHYYGINGSAIKYKTRNICSDATANILKELSQILFPEFEVEIYVLPAKDGCHQDTFWIKLKNGTNNPMLVAVTTVLLTALLTKSLTESQIDVNKSQEELNQLEITRIKNKLSLVQIDTKISDDQCLQIVESEEIKKQTSRHFEQLQLDGEIEKETFISRNEHKKIISETTIESINFSKYITSFTPTEISKTIEKIHSLIVIQPVNERQHKNLIWTVEDVKRKEKFGVYMSDESFYELHFENIIGLTSLIARVRYTFDIVNGIPIVQKKEIIAVYSYNKIERIPLPKSEKIETAPFILTEEEKDDLLKEKDVIEPPTLFASSDF